MRGLTSTLILVVVLAGLGAYIYFVDSKKPAAGLDGSSETKEKVFTVEADKINELRITYQGESSLLKKDASGWKMIEPTPIEADPPEAIGVATALTNVDIVRVIDANATDLEQFGLAKPQITVAFKAEGGVAGTLKLGNKNATQGRSTRSRTTRSVFRVSSFQETSFNRKPFDLRDKKILKFDRDKADSCCSRKARTPSRWRDPAASGRSSSRSRRAVIIAPLKASSLACRRPTCRSSSRKSRPTSDCRLDKPSMTVTIGAGSAKTVLEVGKAKDGETYARDASRPMVFMVDTTLQGDLDKKFDDYRKKELFEFRPFYLARMRAVLDAPGGPKTYEFEKQKPATPSDPETWKVTRVGGTSHTADQTAMDDLLNKLVSIKAEAFVDAKTKTGIDKPALVVSASFDEGKFERVRFGQVGETAYGLRDEAGTKIDSARCGPPCRL
jgi:hypothetical protein